MLTSLLFSLTLDRVFDHYMITNEIICHSSEASRCILGKRETLAHSEVEKYFKAVFLNTDGSWNISKGSLNFCSKIQMLKVLPTRLPGRGLTVWAIVRGREFDTKVHLKTRWIRRATWWQKNKNNKNSQKGRGATKM